MKRFSILGCIAALLSFAGCEEAGKDGYEGTNYIYLSSEADKTTIMESDTTPLAIEVMLSTSLSSDLTLTFAVNGPEGVVELQNNPVTIKAGEKVGSFAIVSLNAGTLAEAANFTVALDPSTVLPESVALKSTFAFVVTPAPAEGELTAEQLAIIAAYKEATGIDLAKYLGEVNVTVEYTGFDNENEVPLDPKPVSSKSVIALSDEATAELPVLKMVTNPMGIQDKMYDALRSVTVDSEEWKDAESYPVQAALMEKINWNSESPEVFTMSLDGIRLNSDKTVEFLGEGISQIGDEIVIVPFEYEFSAYDRELGITDEEIGRDEYTMDATARPSHHLNNTTIEEDDCGYGEEGNWVEAEASISEDVLTFTFCVYMCNNDYDYTKIVATYTPNN